MKKEKFSVGVWAFNVTVDRVTTDGYREPVSTERMYEMASQVEGIDAVEMHYPTQFVDDDIDRTGEVLEKYDLECSNVMVDSYMSRWQNGAYINYDDSKYEEFIKQVKTAIDAAEEFGTGQIGICPTHDGYDYPFQSDFKESYDRFVEGVREMAQYNPDIQVGIEYKPKETRAQIITRSVDRALLLANEVGEDNLGIVMDIGHSEFGQENPAESAYVASRYNMLNHLHLNDSHGIWDDDLTFGSVNFWQNIEFLAWLKILDYDGWYSFDIYPYRLDPIRATEENVENLKTTMKLVEKIDLNSIKEKQLKYNQPDIIKQLREEIFGDL